MPYAVVKNICHACDHKTKVYFRDELFPKVGEVYRYRCSRCGGIVYFRPDAGTILVNGDEPVPEKMVIAEKKEFRYEPFTCGSFRQWVLDSQGIRTEDVHPIRLATL